jgi:hypothetical protein
LKAVLFLTVPRFRRFVFLPRLKQSATAVSLDAELFLESLSNPCLDFRVLKGVLFAIVPRFRQFVFRRPFRPSVFGVSGHVNLFLQSLSNPILSSPAFTTALLPVVRPFRQFAFLLQLTRTLANSLTHRRASARRLMLPTC